MTSHNSNATQNPVESKSVVLAALIANAAIAVLKFIGYLLTFSPAMLSETYHSISDTGNQIFLLIGIEYSHKRPSRIHPFGYGKAQFFYSFLVSVFLFGIAGIESFRHGYDAIIHQKSSLAGGTVSLLGLNFPAVFVNYGVLIGAILFEGYAFSKAYKGMKGEIEKHGWSGFRECFRKTSNVSTLTAFTEDTIAIIGAGMALIGIWLTQLTGNPFFDGFSALLIGITLMFFAVMLAWENQRLLIGESLPANEEKKLRNIILRAEEVREIVDFRTVYFGPDNIIVTADVAMDPDLNTEEVDEVISRMEKEMREANKDIKKVYIEPET